MNITRRQMNKALVAGVSLGALAATFGWPPGRAKAMGIGGLDHLEGESVTVLAPSKEVYAADLVEPERLWAEMPNETMRECMDNGGSLCRHRTNPAFESIQGDPGSASISAQLMWGMKNYEKHHGRRLHDWFELRWATDEERGKANGNGVTPRMVVLVGTVT